MSRRDFERLLLEAVDESLSSLGESSKQAIYYHLEKTFNVEKQEIPENVESFASALERIFGVGAIFIETMIMGRLSKKAAANPKWRVSNELTLKEYVASAKRSYLGKKTEAVELNVDQCKQVEI